MRATGRGRPRHHRRRRQGPPRALGGRGHRALLRRRRVGRRRHRRGRPADARRRHEEDGRPVLHRPRPRHRRRAPGRPPARRAATSAAARHGRCARSTPAAAPRRRPTPTSAWTPGPASPSACSSVGSLPWRASPSAPGSEGGPDARVHRRGRPGRPGARPAHRGVGRRQPRQARRPSPAGASRPRAPSSSCCPSRRRPASPPASPSSELWELVSELPGPVIEPLRDVAAELGIHLVAGTYERGPDARRHLQLLGPHRPVGRGARRLPQDPPVLLRGRRRGRLGHPRRHGHGVRHRARPHRDDHLLRRRLPRAVPHPGGPGRRGHLPPVRPAPLGRRLGAHLTGPRLRQPRLRRSAPTPSGPTRPGSSTSATATS